MNFERSSSFNFSYKMFAPKKLTFRAAIFLNYSYKTFYLKITFMAILNTICFLIAYKLVKKIFNKCLSFSYIDNNIFKTFSKIFNMIHCHYRPKITFPAAN